ncbi:hypothetical protein GCM10009126_02310 [Rhodanobacter caeni]|uniref:PI-PLC Y-box domain-containing protein n=2 Tax=Rhodanobacter caeni TaxID=657654 RepID=A0ABN0U6B8_9GAMM
MPPLLPEEATLRANTVVSRILDRTPGQRSLAPGAGGPHTGDMSNLSDLLLLLSLGAAVGLWLKLSAARERAVREARRLCLQHGLQLLDETVGLRALRLHRGSHGRRGIERCYAFEVSLEGDDRKPAHLWMLGTTISALSLPAPDLPESPVAPARAAGAGRRATDNVVPLRPRRADQRLH